MEANIFSYIDSILFNKNKLPSINETETQFNLFMANRWISMHNPDCANIVNETTNIYASTLTSKQEQYDFLFNIFPQYKKRGKINYLKKTKCDKENPKTDNSLIARNSQLSTREIDQYMELVGQLAGQSTV